MRLVTIQDPPSLLICSSHRSKNDLAKQLVELKTELAQLRVQKIAGGSAAKLTKMCVLSLYQFSPNPHDNVLVKENERKC